MHNSFIHLPTRMREAAAVLLVLGLLAPATAAYATGSGDLDPSFSGDGKVAFELGSGDDEARAVGVQQDKKVVVAGQRGTVSDFGLARLKPDGTLDSTFGTDGKVTTPVSAQGDGAFAVAILPTGNILAAGYANVAGNDDFALARYDTTGALDSTFGTDGKVTFALSPNGEDRANAMVVQSDGKIILGGYATAGTKDFALARFTEDGAPDTSFGAQGKIVTNFALGDDIVRALAIQSDGLIVAAGSSKGTTDVDFALARYSAAGAPDSAFGTGGKVTTPFGTGDDTATSVLLLAEGKIMAVGAGIGAADLDFALAQYTSAGVLDSAFGTGGKVTTPVGTAADGANAAVLTADHKILAAGYTHGDTDDFAVLRYNLDGTLDTTFSADGKTVVGIGVGNDVAWAVAMGSDTKVVAAGSAKNAADLDNALIRLLGDVTAPTGAAVAALSRVQTTTALPVRWSATDADSPAITYDLTYRRAAYNASTFGTAIAWKTATGDTSGTYTTSPGKTYCFRAQATDPAGNVSAMSPALGACTAVPVNDRALAIHGTWTRKTGVGYYLNTYMFSRTTGAFLTLSSVKGKRLWLVATKCSTCGIVDVRLGTTLLKRVNLYATTTRKRVPISISTFTTLRTGTISLKISSTGNKPVSIEGFGVSLV